MPPTLTNRELKNKSTGIDIIVPDYQIIPGKIVNTVLYHVIVITRLFYFKTRQHRESDLVQFAVAKKYEEVEDLHTKLAAKFPSVNFAPLPRMSLIITEKVLNERKAFIEKLLNLIAKTPKLCSSLPVLEFLEVNKISIKQNQLKKAEPGKPKEEVEEKEEEEEEDKEKKDEIDRDIFGVTQYDSSDEESHESSDVDKEDASTVNMKRPATTETAKSSEFTQNVTETAEDFLKSTGKFSFGSHDTDTDLSDLFIPEEALKPDDSKLFVTDDDPDLLKIDDDLDKLLHVSKKPDKKKAPCPKPRASPKPDLKPRPTPKPRFVETSNSADTHFLNKPTKPPKPAMAPKPGMPPKPKPRTRSKQGAEEKIEEKPKKESDETSRPKEKEQTLDDIFGKPSGKDLFSGVDDDEDLFKPESTEDLDVDDITKYIEKNIGQTTYDKVDLFS